MSVNACVNDVQLVILINTGLERPIDKKFGILATDNVKILVSCNYYSVGRYIV